jgi:hypothetical protein
MKPMEYFRAAGLAFLVLLIDVLIAVGIVYAWGRYLQPGHTQDYYESAGIPIARWSSRVFGTALTFIAIWLAVHRQPRRNAYLFAVTFVFFYALLDGASNAFEGFFNWSIALTLSIKLLAALTGAHLAKTHRTRVAL